MIIVIIFFSFFFSVGFVDLTVPVSKPKGCENRPRRLGLHPAREFVGQALGGCKPCLACLHTRSPWVAAKRVGLPLAPKTGQTPRQVSAC